MKIRQLQGLGAVAVALPILVLAGCDAQLAQPNAASNAASENAANGAENSAAENAANNTAVAPADTHTTKLAFSSTPAAIPAGKPATWTLTVTDAAGGAPVKEFDRVHEKLMHLIVVRKDLSWFNHLHPEYKGNGVFTVQGALPSPGTYKLYADYTPKGRKQEVPSHEFATTGAATTAAPKLVADKMQGPWMIKTVVSHDDGKPESKSGTPYQVALMPMPMPVKAGSESMLHFQVRDSKGKAVSDLQPYLGAMGHCVVLSQDTSKYLHSHPMDGDHEGGHGGSGDKAKPAAPETAAPKGGGSDVMFHTTFPGAGLYKVWGQFKHRGKIITAAFVVNAAAADPASAAGGAAEAAPADDHAGHDHAPGEHGGEHADGADDHAGHNH